MKLIFFLMLLSSMVYAQNIKYDVTAAIMSNGNAFQDAIKMGTVYTNNNPSSSSDPFSDKTNKYAEAAVVRIIAITSGCYVKWGSSSIGSATVTDYPVLSGTKQDFVVSPDSPYLRIYGPGAKVVTVELQ